MGKSIERLGGRFVMPIAVVAVVGIAASLVAWHFTTLAENRMLVQEFNGRAGNNALVLQNRIGDYVDKLYALRAFVEVSGSSMTRDDFEIFSRSLLKGYPAILNVAWAPLVKHEQRKEHEQAARNDGIPHYHIQSYATGHGLKVAPEESEYLPKFYSTEPRTSPVYGIDLLHGQSQQATESARDNNTAATSPPFTLQAGEGDRHGFVINLPVYGPGTPNDTPAQRRRNLIGAVQGVFQIGVMFDSILANMTTPVRLYLFAPNAGENDPSLYSTSRLGHRSVAATAQKALLAETHRSFPIDIGDARWTLVAAPESGGLAWTNYRRSWLMLISGLLLTGAAIAYTWSSHRSARRLELASQRISELAMTDALTGLANRRAFLVRLTQAFDAARRGTGPFAVLYFDLDQFKIVNDTLGHPIGDLLLTEVARRAENAVRKTDMVARFGGDEFAVLQSNATDVKAVTTLAVKLNRVLAAPYSIKGHDIRISASIGIALYTAEAKDPESIMMESDIALYSAKDAGRDCFRFYDESRDEQVQPT